MSTHPLRLNHPRVALGHWPTPLEPADRLRAEIGGPRIWIKRDDCSGLAGGGNKTRKLEFLLGAALADAATPHVLTYGALQSNHARQTAAACARLGLRCDLILERQVARDDVHYVGAGNLLLDRLLGATVHLVDGHEEAEAVAARLRDDAEGAPVAEIPTGGSNAVGAVGYVAGTIELAEQLAAAGVEPARLFVGGSTFGTAAGMIVGAVLSELDAVVEVACVARPADHGAHVLGRLVVDTAELVGCATPSDKSWAVDDSTLGPGYGVVTDEVLDAIDVLARTEGILLDPVYTAKAFALVLARIRRGELDPDGDVVFVHTGGTPALHAYAGEWAP